MSKPKRERSLAENEAKAVARMLRVSPQKLTWSPSSFAAGRQLLRSPICSSRASGSRST